jgi:predicted secreted Zn-dependent protease
VASAQQAAERRAVGREAIIRQLLLLLLALATAAPASDDEVVSHAPAPGVNVVEQRTHYDVDAVKLRALRRQLAARPRGADPGGQPVGRTTQRLETRYTLVMGPDGCRLRDLSLQLHITIHLPRWRPKGRRPEELGRRWETMLAALTRHEEGHRDNAVWAALGLQRRLSSLGLAPDCLVLERTAQRERFKMELRYAQRDQAYDRRTDHGVRQGSVL